LLDHDPKGLKCAGGPPLRCCRQTSGGPGSSSVAGEGTLF
jgi:hypothetical protein